MAQHLANEGGYEGQCRKQRDVGQLAYDDDADLDLQRHRRRDVLQGARVRRRSEVVHRDTPKPQKYPLACTTYQRINHTRGVLVCGGGGGGGEEAEEEEGKEKEEEEEEEEEETGATACISSTAVATANQRQDTATSTTEGSLLK